MSQRTADTLGLQTGDVFDISVGGKSFKAKLLGILDGGKSAATDRLMVVDIAVSPDLAESIRLAVPY